jgi:hypothetical protein
MSMSGMLIYLASIITYGTYLLHHAQKANATSMRGMGVTKKESIKIGCHRGSATVPFAAFAAQNVEFHGTLALSDFREFRLRSRFKAILAMVNMPKFLLMRKEGAAQSRMRADLGMHALWIGSN